MLFALIPLNNLGGLQVGPTFRSCSPSPPH